MREGACCGEGERRWSEIGVDCMRVRIRGCGCLNELC